MGYIFLPHDVSATAATFGVVADGPPPTGSVTVRVGNRTAPVADWEPTRGLSHQRVRIGGLSSRGRFTAELLVDGAVIASCSFTTLPEELPRPGTKPFTILLGSCFCRGQDEEGLVVRAYERLRAAMAPEVNVWCGDQVYLDAPAFRFLLPHNASELVEKFRSDYRLTWDAMHGGGSLGGAFASAANYFVPDDHELWNNAPNAAAYVVNSWSASGRATWKTIASDLFRVFQSQSRLQELRVGRVSLLAADTRLDRDADRGRFMTAADLARVTAWISALEGPGLLVLGQPIFHDPAGLLGNVGDWTLVDFEQYAELARALHGSRHSIVMLTGDVHFGRIARCTLPSNEELIEVISSPLALVSKLVGGSWGAPPGRFPARPVANLQPRAITSEPFRESAAHFLTLELSAIGESVRLEVRHWPVDPDEPGGRSVFTISTLR